MSEEKIIICRCEDITLEEVREAIKNGFTTIEEIKRILRTGMGPCQGKSCGLLIAREISQITGTPIEEIELQNIRPPYGGILFKEILNNVGDKIEK
ncbi:(2Fe-2S)-binding protein [Petrotoga sp. 9PWA.NaAc.5.4]|uniref:(2Fe-2S)-binding protein n=1 Tax=Petrotoga sp. 9PWA.NaAc.5.4 TaxID=1434328 RepID=UPI000CC2BACC|nr:(2Fe-2S)-binding protein [Petrotoga sp. 9PWA.NaAc.5.4]PNR94840.1 d-nopaline dehydrogenase [Petrotoga sp. 9PWA.NaAc.5.4]